MVRKRRRAQSGLYLLLKAPWWVWAILAVACFTSFQWLIPAATVGNPLFRGLALTFRPFSYLVVSVFVVLAIVGYFRNQLPYLPISSLIKTRAATCEAPPVSAPADAIFKEWCAAAERAPALRASRPEWSLDILREIEWKRFEEVCAAFYRELGLRSETIRCGADGGIDAKLYRGTETTPSAIVQCKAWNSRPVGVKPVRELLGVMTHHQIAEGHFMTTSDFTPEALVFAREHPLTLISGVAFLSMIRRLPSDSQDRLLAIATEGDYTVPTCPSCGTKMLRRNSNRGDFWGCRGYPRCKHKFFIKQAIS